MPSLVDGDDASKGTLAHMRGQLDDVVLRTLVKQPLALGRVIWEVAGDIQDFLFMVKICVNERLVGRDG